MKINKYLPKILFCISIICFIGCGNNNKTYKNDYATKIINSVDENERLWYEPYYGNDSTYLYSVIPEKVWGEQITILKLNNDGAEEMYFDIEIKASGNYPEISECLFVINNNSYSANIISTDKGIYKSPDRRSAPGTPDQSMQSGNVYSTETVRIFIEPEMVEEILKAGVEIILKGSEEYTLNISKGSYRLAFISNR